MLTGYCATCCMIVDLDPAGLIARHGDRSLPGEGQRWCAGTGQAPSPLPDTTEVAAAAFTEEWRPAKCPRCDAPNTVGGGNGDRLYMRGHLPPGGREGDAMCPGSWMQPTYAVTEAL